MVSLAPLLSPDNAARRAAEAAFDAALVGHMMSQLAKRKVNVRTRTRVKALRADEEGCTNMAVLQA